MTIFMADLQSAPADAQKRGGGGVNYRQRLEKLRGFRA
jgi:hypothetical protein